MSRHRGAAGLVVALTAGLIVAACASPGRKSPKVAGAQPPPPPEGRFDQQKAEIAEMMRDIDDHRRELGLSREPPNETLLQNKHVPVAKLRLCDDDPRPNGEKCKDTCNIKEAICDNAEQICRIADDLEGDEWAVDKCNRAKASCKEATKKCCECASAEIDQHNQTGNVCGA